MQDYSGGKEWEDLALLGGRTIAGLTIAKEKVRFLSVLPLSRLLLDPPVVHSQARIAPGPATVPTHRSWACPLPVTRACPSAVPVRHGPVREDWSWLRCLCHASSGLPLGRSRPRPTARLSGRSLLEDAPLGVPSLPATTAGSRFPSTGVRERGGDADRRAGGGSRSSGGRSAGSGATA
jgi:hypothetical protein